MAKLGQNNNESGGSRDFNVGQTGPTGSFPATLVMVKDYFGVSKPKYGEPNVFEEKDTTRFMFGYNANGETYFVQTWEMTQSNNEKSALSKLLSGMKGSPVLWTDEYDYVDEVGTVCQVTVSSKVSKKGKTYNYVASVAPLLDELVDKAPKLEEVEIPEQDSVENGVDPFS